MGSLSLILPTRMSSITLTYSFHSVSHVERLHFSFKRTVLKLCFSLAKHSLSSDTLGINLYKKHLNSFPRQWGKGRCLSLFQVALGHTSVDAVKATAGGLPIDSTTCLTFLLHSHISSARRRGSGYHPHDNRSLT